MSDKPAGKSTPPPIPPTPPPLASGHIPYASPQGYAGPPMPQAQPPMSSSQRVFDTVMGPNLRLKDNLIQAVCVIVGCVIGGLVGMWLRETPGDILPILIGVLGGLIVSVLASGLVIAVVRGMGAIRK